MECGHARRLLWPPERPRFADPEVVRAKQHIEHCPACRAHFAIDDVMSAVRAGMRQTVPAREVRERLFEAVARQRASAMGAAGRGASWRRAARVSFALAACLILLIVVYLFMNQTSQADRRAAFVEDYLRLAVREDHIVSADAAEVRSFILRELGAHVQPLEAAGFRITGAEVCLLDGRRGAVIRYQGERGILTYYLLPAATRDRLPAPGRPGMGTGTAFVTWAAGGIERALVGPLPVDTLLLLARRTQ